MGVASRIDPTDDEKLAVMKRYRETVQLAQSRLEELMANSDLQSGRRSGCPQGLVLLLTTKRRFTPLR